MEWIVIASLAVVGATFVKVLIDINVKTKHTRS